MIVPALELRELSFSVRSSTILDALTLNVHEGEFFSVIGPNGAGKSTLLRCLMRIESHRGTIRVQGRDIRSYGQRELAGLMSYVPQHDCEAVGYSSFEFVLMARYAHFQPFRSASRADRRAATEALAMTGIESLAERPVAELSGGERRKVSIAAALAQSSRILLVDEPTSFLDPRHQVEILALLRRLNREQGMTIVAVTHDVNTALETADRIGALREGRLIFCGTPSELGRGTVLQSVYSHPFERLSHPSSGVGFFVPKAEW